MCGIITPPHLLRLTHQVLGSVEVPVGAPASALRTRCLAVFSGPACPPPFTGGSTRATGGVCVRSTVPVCSFLQLPEGILRAVQQHGSSLEVHDCLVSRRRERGARLEHLERPFQIPQPLQHRSSADIGV